MSWRFVTTLCLGLSVSLLRAQDQPPPRNGDLLIERYDEVAPRGQPARPNVVVLLADDLGSQDIGCYGGPVKTPALDGLAARGVRFTDFYSGAAVCSPSRATLLTGRHHIRAGVYSWIEDSSQNSHLLQREVTLAEVLKEAGYATVHLGKWHLGLTSGARRKPSPKDHGFDYWFATANNAQPSHLNPSNFIRNGKPVGEIKGYSCQILVDEAITWLETKRDPARPFFLNLWFHEPHAPLAAPDEIVSQYGLLKDPAAIYSATIDNADRAFARLLNKLAQVDAPENTLIIYPSDNGSYRADRVGPLRGTKGSNFEGGIRVPGIFYWPGTIAKGLVEHEPAGQVDLLPTICGLLGLDKPKGVHLDGSDLSPLLTGRGETFKRQQPLFWMLPTAAPAIALREGRWSLVADRAYDLPKDSEGMAALMKAIETLLRKKGIFEQETRGSTLPQQMFEGFKDPEAEALRRQYVRLNMFNESWIPAIKASSQTLETHYQAGKTLGIATTWTDGYQSFQLLDLGRDPGQQTNLTSEWPEVAARLKRQMLEINASVLADGPDWGPTPAEPTVPSGMLANPTEPDPKPRPDDLPTRIEANDLPPGYAPAKWHQDYVDQRWAGRNDAQRAKIARLWQEKQQIDPTMPNRGASFAKILEYVAANVK